MAYKIRTTIAGKTKEIEKYYDFRDNRGGSESRMPKIELSPEVKLKRNEKQAEKKLRQLMNANFNNDSWYVTLTCKKEEGREYETPEEMKRLLEQFQRKCRAFWKRRGGELKYVSVMAIGARSARHFHLVLSELRGVGYKAMREALQQIWDSVYMVGGKGQSFIHIENLYGDNYGELAAYFIKQAAITRKAYGQKIGKRWNSSRNLIKPIVKVRRITNRQAFRTVPKAPAGWYIDDKYTVSGLNDAEFGGYEYMRYILIRMESSVKRI